MKILIINVELTKEDCNGLFLTRNPIQNAASIGSLIGRLFGRLVGRYVVRSVRPSVEFRWPEVVTGRQSVGRQVDWLVGWSVA
jgi:hypothetical protein